MTKNIADTLKQPAIELSRLRWAAGNISPINKNGMDPKPNENPSMNVNRLTSGSKLNRNELIS